MMEISEMPLARIAVIVLAAAVVGLLACLGVQSRPDHRGWRAVKAGAMHWTGVGLGAALTGFFAYIWLFVGSSRADAETQMVILFWLAIAFGTGTIIVGLSIRAVTAKAVRWRGDIIAFASWGGATVKRSFHDIAELKPTLFGRVALRFRDGTELRLDPYATGAGSLIDAIAEHQDKHGES